MPPPGRRPRQPHQAGGLGGHAVAGDELLLLAHRVEEAERVGAEPHQAEDRQPDHRQGRSHEHLSALVPVPRGQHHERQHDAGGDLHAHPRHDRDGGPAQPAAGVRGAPGEWGPAGVVGARARRCPCPHLPPCRQQERQRQRCHHQRVVVRPAHRQLEQHGVQPHERHRPLPRASQRVRGVAHERDRAEAGDGRHGLQGPQPAGQAERRERVAREREQGSVGGVLERPSHEREDRVRRRFGGHVGVGVEPVQRAQARVAEVSEHVLGDQRRTEHEDHVGGQDRCHQRPPGHRPGAHQHQRVAGAHQQRQVLEAVAAERGGESPERPRQPRGPAAGTRGDVLGRGAGGAGAHQQHAREDPEQAEHPQRPRAGRGAHSRSGAGTPLVAAGNARARYRCGRLQGVHSAPTLGPLGPMRPLRFS